MPLFLVADSTSCFIFAIFALSWPRYLFVAGNCVYIRGAVALNKIDTVSKEKVDGLRKEIESKTGMKVTPISAKMASNIDELKEKLFSALSLIRIYLKPKDGPADFNNPLVLDSGSTITEVVKNINSKLVKNTRFAYVTGPSSKFSNQRVGIDHIVKDGDVVTIVFD